MRMTPEQLKMEMELWHTRGLLAMTSQQLAQYQAREAEAQVKRLQAELAEAEQATE